MKIRRTATTTTSVALALSVAGVFGASGAFAADRTPAPEQSTTADQPTTADQASTPHEASTRDQTTAADQSKGEQVDAPTAATPAQSPAGAQDTSAKPTSDSTSAPSGSASPSRVSGAARGATADAVPAALGSIEVRHVDESGKTLAVAEHHDGKPGSAYQTFQAHLDGWHVVSTHGDTQGVYPASGETYTVVYTYAKDAAPAVTNIAVHYLDSTGKQLAISEHDQGLPGSVYETYQAHVDGWHVDHIVVDGRTVTSADGTTTGVYPAEGTTTITYVYAQDTAPTNIAVYHVDSAGHQLAMAEHHQGMPGEKFETYQAHIDGWHVDHVVVDGKTVKDVAGVATGTYPVEGTTTVTYVYAQDAAPTNIAVNYFDQAGNQLSISLHEQGTPGQKYETYQAHLDGWHIDHIVVDGRTVTSADGTTTGVYPETGTTTITYVYAPDSADNGGSTGGGTDNGGSTGGGTDNGGSTGGGTDNGGSTGGGTDNGGSTGGGTDNGGAGSTGSSSGTSAGSTTRPSHGTLGTTRPVFAPAVRGSLGATTTTTSSNTGADALRTTAAPQAATPRTTAAPQHLAETGADVGHLAGLAALLGAAGAALVAVARRRRSEA